MIRCLVSIFWCDVPETHPEDLKSHADGMGHASLLRGKESVVAN